MKNNESTPSVNGLMTMVVRSSQGGPILTREPVQESDLSEVLSEFHRDHVLRKGRPHVPLSDLEVDVLPLQAEPGAKRCLGFRMQAMLEGEASVEAEYGMRSLELVAHRAADRLREQKILGATEDVTYELVCEPAAEASLGRLHCSVATRPLAYLEVPLRPLLKASQASQSVEEGAFHVFYTAAARRRAEHFARLGARDPSRVETGGVLVGFLCSCPETGEFFAVVSEVFEVQDAEQKVFSLAYTSRSWARVHQVVQARQAVQPAVRLLGQCHGHNFLPNGGKICEPCRSRPFCTLTNVFVSADDQSWSRAVFCRQPWQLCHIFGLSARGDQIEALHTLKNGRLSARGYWVLPSFDSAQWPTRAGAGAPAERS